MMNGEHEVKTKYLTWLIPFLILLVSGGVYYQSLRPLQHGGYSVTNDGALIIELRNNGVSDLQLEQVAIDLRLSKVEFGVSYTMQLVIGSDHNQNIIFEELRSQNIYPELTLDQKREAIEKSNGKPIHYGIRIHDAIDVKEVLITYRYWGIRRSEKITVN